jgi:hypothetical protein
MILVVFFLKITSENKIKFFYLMKYIHIGGLMKFLFTIILFSFVFIAESMAQSDTMVISLKNNQIFKIALSEVQKIKFENVTSLLEQSVQTGNISISGNFPNPFQEQTIIEFEIASAGDVIIIIYDNIGNRIQKLECLNCQIGKNSLQWNCHDMYKNKVKSGVYFYEVHFKNEILSKKMIVIK